MCLIPEWNLLKLGIIVGIIGFIILLCIIPIYRKEHPKKANDKPVDKGLILTWTVGIIGAFDIIFGMITGVVGLLICVLNYPVYSYLKSIKD